MVGCALGATLSKPHTSEGTRENRTEDGWLHERSALAATIG